MWWVEWEREMMNACNNHIVELFTFLACRLGQVVAC